MNTKLITEETETNTPETDKAEGWAASKFGIMDFAVVPSSLARRLERERDEAMRRASKLAAQLLAEREEAKRRPTPETDAAADWFVTFSTDPAKKTVPVEVVRKFERERDEARAFIGELVDLVAYGLGQDASIWSQTAMTKAREAIAKAKAREAK